MGMRERNQPKDAALISEVHTWVGGGATAGERAAGRERVTTVDWV